MDKYEYIIGIDASLTSTGIAIINRHTEELLFAAKIMTEKKTHPNYEDRIYGICYQTIQWIKGFSDEPWKFYSGLEDGYVGANRQGSLDIAQLRGAFVGIFKICAYDIELTSSKLIRKRLGSGTMIKEQVFDFVIEKYGEDNEIIKSIGPYSDKPGKKKTSDIYDAISIAIATKRSLDIEQCQEE